MTKSIEIITPTRQYSKPRVAKKMPLLQRMVRFAFGTLGRIFPKFFSKIAFRLFTTPRKRARHKISDPILESAKISDLLYGACLLKVYEWGSGSKTVLLVHGWESRGTALRYFIPELLKQGFHVVAFDAPAHGNSTGKRTNLPHFAGAVKAMLHRFKNVEGIITHSFGGATSIYALTQLDPSLEVGKMVLVAMPSEMHEVIGQALDAMNAPANVRKYFTQKLESVARLTLDEMNISQMNHLLNVEKAMVVHDMQDEVVSFHHAEKVVSSWNDTHLLATNGFGHFHLMKSPEVVEKVAMFLSES